MKGDQTVITKIWNAAFISIVIANAMMNLGQQMVNSLVSKYADYLGAPSPVIGMLTGAFAATALVLKIISGPAIDSFDRKKILLASMVLMAISYVGFGLSRNILMLYICCLMEGAARAFTATVCLAIAADTLPRDRFGAGIGVYSLAQTACMAIGPTISLTLYRIIGYNNTFFLGAILVSIGVLTTVQLKVHSQGKSKFKVTLSRIFAKEALIPAILNFVLSGTFLAINSFLAIYAINMGVVNIGFFFTVYAGTMLISRPLVGRMTDRYGLVRIMIPAIFAFALAFYLISIANSLWMFLLAAFVSAFGYGAASPAIQTLCMKCVPDNRRGAASSSYFVSSDLGNLIGPVMAGVVVSWVGYQRMWQVMIVPIFLALVYLLVCSGKINAIERNFSRKHYEGKK